MQMTKQIQKKKKPRNSFWDGWIENIVGKEENVGYQPFFSFSHNVL